MSKATRKAKARRDKRIAEFDESMKRLRGTKRIHQYHKPGSLKTRSKGRG
jgi:hypothetical protein